MHEKVAICGAYSNGNFGDLLLALTFGKLIKAKGMMPVLFKVPEDIAKAHGFESAASADVLFESAAFAVYGGGGLLLGGQMSGDDFLKLDREYADIAEAAEKYKCLIYPVAIGGDGEKNVNALSPGRQRLIKSPQFQKASVRVRADIDLLKSAGKDSVFFPDILWAAEKIWKPRSAVRTKGEIHVAFAVDRACGECLVTALERAAMFLPRVKFFFMNTHLLRYGKMPYLFVLDNPKGQLQNYIFGDMSETLEFLKGIDLMVTSRLHPLMTAMSLGVPAVSFGENMKARMTVSDAGINYEQMVIPSLRRLSLILSTLPGVMWLRSKARKNTVSEALINESMKHMQFLYSRKPFN